MWSKIFFLVNFIWDSKNKLNKSLFYNWAEFLCLKALKKGKNLTKLGAQNKFSSLGRGEEEILAGIEWLNKTKIWLDWKFFMAEKKLKYLCELITMAKGDRFSHVQSQK